MPEVRVAEIIKIKSQGRRFLAKDQTVSSI